MSGPGAVEFKLICRGVSGTQVCQPMSPCVWKASTAGLNGAESVQNMDRFEEMPERFDFLQVRAVGLSTDP